MEHKLNELLLIQLQRYQLNSESPPSQEEWRLFLQKISHTYNDHENESNLLTNLIETVSKEITEINHRLNLAQDMAKIGSWSFYTKTGKIVWSKQVYKLVGFGMNMRTPEFNEMVTDYVHPEDRDLIQEKIKNAFIHNTDTEAEIRLLYPPTHSYRWYYIKGRPYEAPENNPDNILSGIIMDIHDRKENDAKLKNLHLQLMNAAKQAGMMEIAISVLHNVGNVLNSIKVSVDLLQESTNVLRIQNLQKAINLIFANKDQLADYLVNDPKGSKLAEFIDTTLSVLSNEYKTVKKELDSLTENILHIKNIIEKQQSIHGVSGLIEQLNLIELLETIYVMCRERAENHNINIIKNYPEEFIVKSDKSKLLQILLNLITNSKDSLIVSKKEEKVIEVNIEKVNDQTCRITVKDNGMGIAPDNLKWIFNFGFTTKLHGHGFGLHSSAILAKELGGKLAVESPGLNQGATFTLEIPLICATTNNLYDEIK